MDKHTEIIFNLFIMKFFYEHIELSEDAEAEYDWITNNSEWFQYCKSCFPENEIACNTIIVGDARADLDCNVIYNGVVKSRRK